jgi:sugar phosphate isomerase/epimerase
MSRRTPLPSWSMQRKRLAQKVSPLVPSVVVWQAYAPYLASGGSLLEAVEDVAAMDFFASIEIPVIDDVAARQQLRQITTEAGWEVMVWASEVQAKEKLSLAALDRSERERARLRFHELVHQAAECGAQRFGFCSPPDSAPNRRPDAIRHLIDELVTLASDAQSAGVSIVLEALDRHAHKKGLLGTALELADLCREVTGPAPTFGVTWDSAHAALNGEDLVASFTSVQALARFVHFSEAILDPARDQFGDWHMPIGSGDVLTPATVQKLLLAAMEHGRRERHRIALTVEEFNRDPQISGGESLHRAWSYLGDCL